MKTSPVFELELPLDDNQTSGIVNWIIASDFHGNLEATKKFLEHIGAEFASGRYHFDNTCMVLLGDYIDYGGNSAEVVKLLMQFCLCKVYFLYGNHEEIFRELATIRQAGADVFPKNFFRLSSTRGKNSALLTYDQLDKPENNQQFCWLMNLQSPAMCLKTQVGGMWFAHGNINDPIWGKLENMNADLCLADKTSIFFGGHTHKPLLEQRGSIVLCNVGSIGQPRWGSKDGTFATLEIQPNNSKAIIKILKFEYDVNGAYNAVKAMNNQHPYYAERLLTGI